MADETPSLKIPYILPSQAQKHVTHNAAMAALDAIVQAAALDRDLTAPPATPAEGDCYIVGAPATGDWSGQEARLAAWQNGGWNFYAAPAGFLAWAVDESAFVVSDGAGWAPLSAVLETVSLLGINATANTTNRLAVSAPATLLDHEGAGHQVKVNKATATDTASLLFQDAYSGRAEMGLAGNDNFSIKVSDDGIGWTPALAVDAANGNVGLGTEAPAFNFHIASTLAYAALEDTDGVMGGSMHSALRFYAAGLEEHGSLGFPGTSAGVMYLRNKRGNLYIQADTDDLKSSSLITLEVDGSTVMKVNPGHIEIQPGAAPSAPSEGAVYFDATTKKLRCHDGTTWHDLF